jgi:hypothetical protein
MYEDFDSAYETMVAYLAIMNAHEDERYVQNPQECAIDEYRQEPHDHEIAAWEGEGGACNS